MSHAHKKTTRRYRGRGFIIGAGVSASCGIAVANPDPNTEGTFSRLVGRDVEDFDFRQAFFEDYVASLHE
jgi:hypothetical protein